VWAYVNSSLFTSSESERQEANLSTLNTYTLFSQSPWPIGLRSQNVDTSSEFTRIMFLYFVAKLSANEIQYLR